MTGLVSGTSVGLRAAPGRRLRVCERLRSAARCALGAHARSSWPRRRAWRRGAGPARRASRRRRYSTNCAIGVSAHQVGPAEHLEMARDRGLREVEHRLQVGDEQRRGRQTVEDPEPGRLGDREQQVGGGGGRGSHMRWNIYDPRRICARSAREPRVYCTAMLSLLIAASLVAVQPQDTAHVVLVATTDVHGHVTGCDYLADRAAPGGLARGRTVTDSLGGPVSRTGRPGRRGRPPAGRSFRRPTSRGSLRASPTPSSRR